eukprot:2339529-Prymnesium_polylepis.1
MTDAKGIRIKVSHESSAGGVRVSPSSSLKSRSLLEQIRLKMHVSSDQTPIVPRPHGVQLAVARRFGGAGRAARLTSSLA